MARRSKGEGSISTSTRNGKPYYKASVTIGYSADGKQIRKSFGSFKKSVVIDKLNKVKYEAKTNTISSDSGITFGNLYQKWVEDYKKNEVQSNTYDDYLTCYKLHIEPYPIAGVKASQITLDFLQRYFNSLQAVCTPNNIRKIFTKVNSCFKFALLHGVVQRNYCQGVTLQKIQRKQEDQYKVFTKEEQERLIANLDFRNVLDQVIYLDFYTGLRLGEILALKWSRLDGNILHIKEQYQRATIFEEGKKKTAYEFKDFLKTPTSERDIPIPQKIIDFLNNLERTGDLMFSDQGEPIERKRPDRRIKYHCKKLGIPPKTFHSIRHTYATRLFEANVPIKTVQALLGHADIDTTMSVYTHVMPEKKMEVLDVLNSI